MEKKDWFSLPQDSDSDGGDTDSGITYRSDSSFQHSPLIEINVSDHSCQRSHSLSIDTTRESYNVKSLSRQTLGYFSNSGAVPRLSSGSKCLSRKGHTHHFIPRQSFGNKQATSCPFRVSTDGAASSHRLSHLSQYSLSDCGGVTNEHKRQSEALSQYTLPDMDPELINREDRISQDNITMNHTTSTNESQNEESSQISPPRGFSSDDGSGWKSETTETSDGNFSLSQYPLDVTGDESVQNNGSAHEEFVSSAISEVSKDFISGNFSPTKYPTGSNESDSMSDTDHNVVNNQQGTVYARYPESVTGLSDCDWNPYATESDTNHTPRSSVSDGPLSSVVNTLAQLSGDNQFDRISGSNDNNSAIDKPGQSNSPAPATEYSQPQQHMNPHLQQNVASYVLYSPDTRSTSTVTTATANSNIRLDGRSNTSSRPESGTQSSQGSVSGYDTESYRQFRVNQFLPPSLRQTEELSLNNLQFEESISNREKLGYASVSTEFTSEHRNAMARPEPIGRTSKHSDAEKVDSVNLPSRSTTQSYDPVRLSVSKTNGEQGSKDGVYLPIEEREKLLGYSQSLDPPRERLSDPGLQSFEPSTSSSRNRLSDGALPPDSFAESDVLSQRVAKLLTDANQLGSSLHESLYNKKALGLEDHDSFPKYKFSPVKTSGAGITTPSPTLHGPTGEELLKSGRSQASDHSLRSSLGEEVAKLLGKTDEVSGTYEVSGSKFSSSNKSVPTVSATTFKPISEDNNDQNKMELSKLSELKNLSSADTGHEGHVRRRSEESQESLDSLDQRVKELLQKTSYVEKKQPLTQARNVENLPFSSYIATSLDYSRLQKDLQEIQNSLNTHLPTADEKSDDKENLMDSMKQSEKSFVSTSETESLKSGGKKLLWDHAADLGYDDSATGRFVGTMKSLDVDTEAEISMKTPAAEVSASTGDGSYGTDMSGKLSQKSENTMKLLEALSNGNDSAISDVVSDHQEVEGDEAGSGNVAQDVEEIIARYQKQRLAAGKMEINFQEDTTGLANRVFKILTQEPPEKQATGILEKAMKDERKLIQKMAERPKLDSSYDGFGIDSANSTFAPHDKDIRKQLEWSEMSSLDHGHPSDKTGISEMSFKGNAPFSALGNANTFFSGQLQKMSDRTFDHSIELRTPFRRAIECYPVYGMEKDALQDKPGEKRQFDSAREAWPEEKQAVSQGRQMEDQGERGLQRNPLASERFYLNALDTTPVGMRYRRYSDPDSGGSPLREAHSRSKSEENKCLTSDAGRFYNLESYNSSSNRRVASSPTRGNPVVRPKEPLEPSPVLSTNRKDAYDSTPPVYKRTRYQYYYRETSPSSSGVPSPGDSDLSSTRRREGTKLRPYRPPGSREVYYTESADESASVADSITTMESTHTGNTVETLESSHSASSRRVSWKQNTYLPSRGSDDAMGPYIPSHHLGSRVDLPGSTGIYGNKKQGQESVDDGLSTIEEKSIADEKDQQLGGIMKHPEKSNSRGNTYINESDRRDSGLELSSKAPTVYDRVQSRNSDHYSDKSASSKSGGSVFGRDSLGGSRITDKTGSAGYDESKLSYTTRSDPGDQFATPKRSRDYDISSSSEHMLQNHHDITGNKINEARLKSRSETDLSMMNPEPYHKSSSPMYGTRLMDLSAQPSPILSLHTTLNSPAVPSVGSAVRPGMESTRPGMESTRSGMESTRPGMESTRSGMESTRPGMESTRLGMESIRSGMESTRPGMESIRSGMESTRPGMESDKYLEDRLRQKPLEKGSNYQENPLPRSSNIESTALTRHNDRATDYVARPLESGAGLLNKDLDKQTTKYADRPTTERMSDFPVRPLEMGGGLLGRDSDRPIEYSNRNIERPVERMSDLPVRPLEKGPGLTKTNVEKASELPDKYISRPYDTDGAYLVRPLEKGPALLERNATRGPEFSDQYDDKSSERQREYSSRSAGIHLDSLERDTDRLSDPSDRYSDRITDRIREPSVVPLERGNTDTNTDYRYSDKVADRKGDYSVRPLERGAGMLESYDKPRLYSDEFLKQDTEVMSKPLDMNTLHRPLDRVNTNTERQEFTHTDPVGGTVKELDFQQGRQPIDKPTERVYNSAHIDRLNENTENPGHTGQRLGETSDKKRERSTATGPADVSDYLKRERGRPLDRGADYLDMFIPRSLDEPGHARSAIREEEIREGRRSRDRSEERRQRSRSRSRSPATALSQDNPVEYNIDGEIFTEPPKVPDPEFEDIVKAERLKVRKEMEMMKRMKQQQHGQLLRDEDVKEFGAEYDCIPPSRKAQALRETLEKENVPNIPTNINDLWNRFQELNETQSDSSMNTSRLETLTSLLNNPTRHVVYKALDEQTYQRVKEKKLAQELVAMEKELLQNELELRRQELQKRRKRLSNENNGSYTEVLNGQKPGSEKSKKEKNNQNQGAKTMEELPRPSELKKLGESADTLYSIPEDTSFDSSRMSSPKNESVSLDQSGLMLKSKHARKRHIIDPLMSKLRDKVQRQRDKINKERIKELKRMDKLKKLELLLTAKRKGKLTDRAINVELEEVSTTSVPQSDESSTLLDSESALSVDTIQSDDSNRATIDTTSSKDSSIELQRTRIRKPKQSIVTDVYSASHALGELPQDSESQSDIIVVRKSRKSKSDKSGKKEKKSRKKEKSVTLDEETIDRPRSSKRNKDKGIPELDFSMEYEKRKGKPTRHRSDVSPSREKYWQETTPTRQRKYRDIGVNYPSPIVVSPPTHRWITKEVAMKSAAIQTDGRSLSPAYGDAKVIPVPLMSPERSRKSRSTSPKSQISRGRKKTSTSQTVRLDQSKSSYASSRNLSPVGSSPSRSQLFTRSYTPPRSLSPSLRSRSSPHRSKSPQQQRNRSTSRSKMFIPESDSEYEKFLVTTPPKNKMFTPETPDDDYAGKIKGSPSSGGLAWYIPVEKEKKPWKKPLKEQQAYALKRETWQPKNIEQSTWKNIVNSDILNKSRSKDTQFNLDTKGQRLEEDLELRNASDEENIDPKPLNKLSLQDAFNIYKQNTISRVRARQKRVTLAAEERKLQHELAQERNRLFTEQRKKEANPDAHPYSENLHEPKKRAMTKQEMKELTKKSYKKLPEVVKQKQLKKRQEDYALNRLKAKVFNRKVQKTVLQKK